MAGILDIDAGNTFLTSFLARFNQRFAIRRRSLKTCIGTQYRSEPPHRYPVSPHGRSSPSTTTASRSSWNATRFRRTSAASMSNSTTSWIGLWR
jgi:hypothetical protein